jgi:hypothetical protein
VSVDGSVTETSEVFGPDVDDFSVARAAAGIGRGLGELLTQLVGFLGRQDHERLAQPDELGRHDTECT